MKAAELILTKAWQEQASWLTALRPLSKLYELASDYNKNQYQNGKKPIYKAPVPVLVIGNITVGGSGKTPLIITLVKYLQTKNIAVGVISRGYGGNPSLMPSLVSKENVPDEVGDEPCLIVQETDVPMAVCPDRKKAIELLLSQYPDLQLIISDDGLQHHKLYRDAEWIVVDAERGFGNQKLFPEGFLREPIERLEDATVIYHFANKINASRSDALHTCFLEVGTPRHLCDKNRAWSKSINTVYGLTGIGYPTRFFNSLKGLGLTVLEHPKPDHHHFAFDDIKTLQGHPILVTAKDAVKIQELISKDNQSYFDDIWVLPVEMQVSDGVFGLLDEFLQSALQLSNG